MPIGNRIQPIPTLNPVELLSQI